MRIQISFRNRATGFYLGLVGSVLAIVALVCYLLYGSASGDCNPMILLSLLAAVLLQFLSLWKDSDIPTILSPCLCTVALCSFLMDSVYTLVGYVTKLDMFGDIRMIGYVAQVCILSGLAAVVLIVSAFLKKNKVC